MFRARPGDCFRLWSGYGCGPRVAAGEARGSTAAVPRVRAVPPSLLAVFWPRGQEKPGANTVTWGFPAMVVLVAET
jgi:hypothetical protein